MFCVAQWSAPAHGSGQSSKFSRRGIKFTKIKSNKCKTEGDVLVTYKSAPIKGLNHLFWIITLLSKGTAAACLRRNLICLCKNSGGGSAAQRNPGKRVMADRPRQLPAMALTDSHQLSLDFVCFCSEESSAACLAPCSACTVSHKRHLNRQFKQTCCHLYWSIYGI